MESGNRLARGTRGESCRFEIRRVMEEKQKKKKKTNNFQFRFVYYSRFVLHSRGGRTSTSVFFSSCNLSGGKNRGKGGEKRIVGVLGKRRSTNRVAGNTQIRNSVPLVIFRGTLENVRAKDFPGKPLICILIEEIITFTGVWPIYKVNRLTPSAPWIFSFNVNPLININAPLSNIGRVCLNFWIELNTFPLRMHTHVKSNRGGTIETISLRNLFFSLSLFVFPLPDFFKRYLRRKIDYSSWSWNRRGATMRCWVPSLCFVAWSA